jgi:hypothetical protein
LVLRPQMPVWNYFVNSFYSVGHINRSQTHECEIGAEAALFPEKEYISGIFFAV